MSVFCQSKTIWFANQHVHTFCVLVGKLPNNHVWIFSCFFVVLAASVYTHTCCDLWPQSLLFLSRFCKSLWNKCECTTEVLSKQCEVLFYGAMETLLVDHLKPVQHFTFCVQTNGASCCSHSQARLIQNCSRGRLCKKTARRLALLNVFSMPLSPPTFSSPRPRSSSKNIMLKLIQRW